MAVSIGSARLDENGRYTGGKAGNQTGKELSLQNWYKHAKGWVVLRAKSSDVAERIAVNLERACKNLNIGYDQGQRNTLYQLVVPLGYDCSKVTTPCETDCSALVRVCVNYAGIRVGDFNTGSQASTLMATGAFDKLTESRYTDQPDYLRRGDILVTQTKGHTVVVLNDGPMATGAPVAPTPPQAPEATTQRLQITGGTVNYRKGPGTRYAIAGTVRQGDFLAKVDPSGWSPVEINGAVYWVSAAYTKEV